MKKGKTIGKKQIVTAVLILALAGTIWINMKYSASQGDLDITGSTSEITKNLGDTQYVNADNIEPESVETAASNDYFSTTQAERDKSRQESLEILNEQINDVKTDEEIKKSAIENKSVISKRIEDEAAIESLIKAKGFEKVVAVIGDEGINIVVKSQNLLASESLQIQDIVITQTGVSIDKIKIITIK